MTSAGGQRTVLVADDDADLRETLVAYLRTHGFDTLEAANGLETLLHVKRARPDVVLLDLMMPRLGGMDALKRIRDFNPGITVLILTGTDDAVLRREAIALGAAAVVSKPIAPGDLLSLLGRPGVDDGVTTPRDHDERGDIPTVIGTDGVRVLIVDDDAEVAATMSDFLQSRGYPSRTVDDAASALRLVVEAPPDVILLDITMPGLSGIDALPALRALAPAARVIMVSGLGDLDIARRALAYGAFDYVSKPVDLAYLAQSLETAMSLKQLERG